MHNRLPARALRLALLGVALGATTTAATAASAEAAPRVPAPKLTLQADGSLAWSKVGGARRYVLLQKVRGSRPTYVVVPGRKATPRAAAGTTMTFMVRAALRGARWSPARTIRLGAPVTVPVASVPTTPATPAAPAPHGTVTSPAPVPTASTPAPAPAPAPAPTTPAPAPTTTTSAPTTPAPAPAPTTSTPAPTTQAPAPTTPAPAPAPSAGPEVGVVSGASLTMNLGPLRALGAHTTRAEFSIDATVAEVGPAVEAAVRAGVQPILLAGFQGQDPTPAEIANVATWAKAFGPGGSWWAGKGIDASAAPTHIEFGNETSYGYQYAAIASDPNWATTSFYRQLAMEYGRDVRSLAVQVAAANPAVDVLAVGDAPGNWPQWMDGMFAGAPDLARYVGGWTVHPYGPGWKTRMDSVANYSAAHGSTAPMYATEYGISTDDGRCLTQNYGWDRCMTYAQAASAVTGAIQGMEARYGSRLGGVWLYQATDQTSSGASDDSERYFGTLTVDGRAKGAYTSAVRALLQ